MEKFALSDSVTGNGIVGELEQKFSRYTGSRFAVAMSNCTSAIHAGLFAIGIKRGNEVITPAYTWGGTIAGLLSIGAIPVFADIDDTMTLDIEDVKRKITNKTKAVIAVHIFGHPCDMDSLTAICNEYNLSLIEDCAQSFGARLNGRHVGTFGIGCFSFGYGKSLCAGEGGMIITDNENIYDQILFHTQHPFRQRKDMHSFCEPNEFALNYRIHPRTAQAIVESFDSDLDRLAKKVSFFNNLHQEILQNPPQGLTLVTVRDGVEHSWHRYSPKIIESLSDSEYESIRAFFNKRRCDIGSGYIQTPLYRHSALNHYLPKHVVRVIQKSSLPQTESACKTHIGISLNNKGKG